MVPKIKKNLLSISQLTRDNDCSIEFFANQFVIKDQQGQMLAKGYEKGGLYALEDMSFAQQAFTAISSNKIVLFYLA